MSENKEMMVMLCGFTMEVMMNALDRVPQEAESEGITTKEWVVKNGLDTGIIEIGEMLSQLPDNIEGREELFEIYEELLEKVESFN